MTEKLTREEKLLILNKLYDINEMYDKELNEFEAITKGSMASPLVKEYMIRAIDIRRKEIAGSVLVPEMVQCDMDDFDIG